MLPNLIEDLTYSVQEKGDVDTSFLRHFLVSYYLDPVEDTSKHVLSEILEHALALPTVFPQHGIFYLGRSYPMKTLTSQQIKSLIAHQILGTLTPPRGNTWGCTFLCWYSEPPKCSIRIPHDHLSLLPPHAAHNSFSALPPYRHTDPAA